MESLNEENQKYLDLIIKHSLGGVGGKTIRKQLARNRNRRSNLDRASSYDNRSYS